MTKRRILPPGFRNQPLLEVHDVLFKHIPQVYRWLTDPEDCVELRLKNRLDGTTIAIAKGLDADGAPIVAFGSGYDPLSALMSLEGTFAANRWRPDKPWSPPARGGEEE